MTDSPTIRIKVLWGSDLQLDRFVMGVEINGVKFYLAPYETRRLSNQEGDALSKVSP